MNNRRRRIITAFAATATVVAMPAHALFGVGDIVIDPSNLVQNTSSAIAAIKNEVNTATALIHQIQSAINLGKSLTSVKGLASLAGLQKELDMYHRLKAAGTEIQSLMNRSLSLSKRLEGAYSASRLPWKEFAAYKMTTDKLASEAMLRQYESIDESLAQVASRRKDIVNQLQDSEGQTAALQAVGTGIDALIGQNQLLISSMNAQGKLAQKSKIDEAAAAKGSNDAFSERQRRLIEADKPYQ